MQSKKRTYLNRFVNRQKGFFLNINTYDDTKFILYKLYLTTDGKN